MIFLEIGQTKLNNLLIINLLSLAFISTCFLIRFFVTIEEESRFPMVLFFQSNSWAVYFIIIASLIFLGFGIGMLVKLAQNYRKLQRSKHWLSIKGVITSSDLNSQVSTDDEGFQTTTYLAKIAFSYEVNGVKHESDHINFDYGIRTSNLRGQQAIVDHYPVKKEVRVYYDPDDPTKAILEKRVNGAFTTILVSAVFIAIGVILAMSSLGGNPPPFLKNLLGN